MQPCRTYLGFRDPMAAVAAFCDLHLACWLGSYSTPEQYQDCLTSADAGLADCGTRCAPGDDGTAAGTARAACDATCDSTAFDCATECLTTFDACVGGPEDDCGPFTDCGFACQAAKADCEHRCHDQQQGCRSTCYLNYHLAIAGIPPADANCGATCCSSKPDHIRVCSAPCQDAYNTASTDANVTYWSCVSGCSLAFWDGGDVFIYDSTCTTGCEMTRQASLGDAQKDLTLCNFDCQAIYDNQWTDCGGNYRCSRQCISDHQDAVLLCSLAALGGADASTYAHCQNDAETALSRCNLECCFNLQGRNLFDMAAIECLVTQSDCVTAIVDTCPAPDTGSGGPCEHPASDECAAAAAAHDTCVATETATCTEAYKGCIGGISAKSLGACGGCLGL